MLVFLHSAVNMGSSTKRHDNNNQLFCKRLKKIFFKIHRNKKKKIPAEAKQVFFSKDFKLDDFHFSNSIWNILKDWQVKKGLIWNDHVVSIHTYLHIDRGQTCLLCKVMSYLLLVWKKFAYCYYWADCMASFQNLRLSYAIYAFLPAFGCRMTWFPTWQRLLECSPFRHICREGNIEKISWKWTVPQLWVTWYF